MVEGSDISYGDIELLALNASDLHSMVEKVPEVSGIAKYEFCKLFDNFETVPILKKFDEHYDATSQTRNCKDKCKERSVHPLR